MKARPFIGINIVPTGIGASIGGYAGDSGPANQLLAASVDLLITNPNVVNAATLHNIPDNVLYTEGFALNRFCKGDIALRLSRKNKIGIVFDKDIPKEVLNVNINAINACIAVYGLEILGYTLTDDSVGIEYNLTEDAISSGNIRNPGTLLNSCFKMIQKGANALAIVCMFPDDEKEDLYAKGYGADPVGGVEAIISHLVSSEFNIPCAHAPAFSYNNILPGTKIVDPRAAAEYFSPTFLPCVLVGLNQAPQLINSSLKKPSDITIDDVEVLITPSDCLGSLPVISCIEKAIAVIAVKNNTTVLDVTAEKLGIIEKIIISANYLEACGYITALKSGICPETILRPIQQCIEI